MPLRLLLALAVLVPLALPARAQFGDSIGPAVPETVVAWTANVRPPTTAEVDAGSFRRGDVAFVTLTAEVAPGWRLYAHDSPGGMPLRVMIDPLPEGLRSEGRLGEDAPRDGYDAALGEGYRYHSGRARIWQGLRVDERAPRGAHVVTGRVRYAACNDSICLPPREAPFRARLVVQ